MIFRKIKPKITKILKKILSKIENEKKIVSTSKKNLDIFSTFATEREWQQITMYCHVMNEIRDIPGDIAEFGVASGTSFLPLVRLNDVFDNYKHHQVAKRSLYGFDTFEGLPYFDQNKDTGKNEVPDMKIGGFNAKNEYEILKNKISKFKNVKLYKGTFEKTIPEFLKDNNHVSFSLLHIDCDLHQSTLTTLKYLLPRLNVGGIILFDEIFHLNYPGETSGFFEAYNSLIENDNKITIKFKRLKSMPWKWYGTRIR